MVTRMYVASFLLYFVMAKDCPPGYVNDTQTGIYTCQICNVTGCICTNIQNCKGCIDGYFMSKYLCILCPDNCLNCTNTTQCTSCKTGFTGNMCESEICANNRCLCNSFLGCDSCKDGFYNASKYCTYECDSNCYSCTNNTTCDTCKPGMYGTDCRNACSTGCSNKICSREDGSCSCTPNFTGRKCDQCRYGWYGPSCNLKCSFGCNATKECNQPDGSCVCSAYFMGEICDQCKVGRYGIYCESVCSNGCNTTCNRNNGTCLCSKNFTGDLCNECERGLFGESCEHPCSNGCNNITCNKAYGSCSCASNFDGDNCDHCIPGRYGHFCERVCSRGCNTTDCKKSDGSCVCSGHYTGERCDQCNVDRYGISCESVCSRGCNTPCNPTNGTCSCLNNFTGDLCDECEAGMYGESCELKCSSECNGTCNRTDGTCKCWENFAGALCNECQNGWYDDDCKSACSFGCIDTCNSLNGTCNCFGNYTGAKCDNCLNGTYGLYCNRACSEGCVDRVCDIQNGTCTCLDNFTGYNCKRCVTGMYGSFCELKCSHGCDSRICNHTDGSCSCLEGFTGLKCDTCIAGRYGSQCSHICSHGCAYSTCKASDGSCRCSEHFTGDKCDQCIPGKYGSFCKLFCSQGCFLNECNSIDGNCSCSGNFTGDRCDRCVQGKYGDNCTFQCPFGCLNNLCNHKGECSDGCLRHFFGNMCNQTCPVNCKNGTSNGTRCERATGSCQLGCNYGFSGHACETAIGATLSDELPLAAIAGGAGGGLIAIFVIGLIVFCRIRKRIPQPQTVHDNLLELNVFSDGPVYATVQRNNSGERNMHNDDVSDITHTAANGTTVNKQSLRSDGVAISRRHSSLLTDEDGLEIDKDEAAARLRAIKFEKRGGVYNNCASKLHKSTIRVSELMEFVDSKDQTYFEEEFEKLPKGMTKKYDVSQMSMNMPMNRYKGVYPYDDSRVILHVGVTDYINASYIDGYKQRHAYIATLGPTSKHLGDFSPFWRMIWQQKIDKIVMVTNFVEEGKDKCDQYFPDLGLSQTYGEICVKCTSEEEYAEFVRRIFTVSVDNDHRTLYHLHFTAWPDKDIPEDVTSIVEFRTKVLNAPAVLGGPTVVHCSAGIGRSGTYIALDILIREGEAENMVDIPGCVLNMRHNRPHMVQTKEQYEYLHHALVHALTFDCKPVGIDRYRQYIEDTSNDAMTRKFQHLTSTIPKLTNEEQAAIDTNQKLEKKNRRNADIPGDAFRPRLHLIMQSGKLDYINAVYMNSFKKKKRWILAQTPLPETVNSFLTLLVQEHCSCVVNMDSITENNATVGVYFQDDNKVYKNGLFTLRGSDMERGVYMTKRSITIQSSEILDQMQTIPLLHFTDWNTHISTPNSARNFLLFIKDVESVAKENNRTGPILVHCMDAASKCGLFSVVSTLMETIAAEREVSVTNVVRKVKVWRRSAIQSKEQFQFCHDCVLEYTQGFDNCADRDSV